MAEDYQLPGAKLAGKEYKAEEAPTVGKGTFPYLFLHVSFWGSLVFHILRLLTSTVSSGFETLFWGQAFAANVFAITLAVMHIRKQTEMGFALVVLVFSIIMLSALIIGLLAGMLGALSSV